MENISVLRQKNSLQQMQRSEIYYVNLAIADHRILSSDAKVIDFVQNDLFTPFEEQLYEDSKAAFLRAIENFEEEWFPIRLLKRGADDIYYLRYRGTFENKYLRFAMVHPVDVIAMHAGQVALIQSLLGILSLYDDICFMARPAEDLVVVMQTDALHFKDNVYTMQGFADTLLECCPTVEQKQQVQGYLADIEHGRAMFNHRVTGDILGKGHESQHTMLRGSTQIVKDGTKSVFGFLHAERGRGIREESESRDYLTGAYTKEEMTRIGIRTVEERHIEGTVLAILDIDYFKSINDTYGHKMGDEVLQKVAGIITNELGSDGDLGRFGGDEFVIMFRRNLNETELRAHFSGIKNAVRACFPTLNPKGDGPLTVSIGSARYPADAKSFDDLFMVADYCLYVGKNKGRNRYIMYTPGKHLPIEEIRASRMNAPQLPARENTTLADTIVNMMYDVEFGIGKPSAERFLTEFWPHLNVSAMLVFSGSPYKLVYQKLAEGVKLDVDYERAAGMISKVYTGGISRDFITVNQLSSLPDAAREVKDYLEQLHVESLLEIQFTDASGNPSVLLLATIDQKKQWNQLHYRYYRLFAKVLGRCKLGE